MNFFSTYFDNIPLGSAWFILCIVLTGVTLLSSGIFYGRLWQKRLWLKLRTDHCLIRKQHQLLKEANTHQSAENEKLTYILKAKAQNERAKSRLIADIQERYRMMATQALAVNNLVPRLLLEEASESKVIKEISDISKENNALLKRIMKGNPRIEREEPVDITQCFEKIHEHSLPEIMENELIVKVSGKIKEEVMLDKRLLELVLYNLFHRVIDRNMKEGRLKIELKTGDPLQIVFYDNGYDIENLRHIAQSKSEAEDILNLSKSRLQELVSSLGWKIEFCSTKGKFHSAIILSIPRPLKTDASNVVSLFPFKRFRPEKMGQHF